jgi:hypothetical protein
MKVWRIGVVTAWKRRKGRLTDLLFSIRAAFRAYLVLDK